MISVFEAFSRHWRASSLRREGDFFEATGAVFAASGAGFIASGFAAS
jgi:hypothetical protein